VAARGGDGDAAGAAPDLDAAGDGAAEDVGAFGAADFDGAVRLQQDLAIVPCRNAGIASFDDDVAALFGGDEDAAGTGVDPEANAAAPRDGDRWVRHAQPRPEL